MSDSTPDSVIRYIQRLDQQPSAFAFFRLDDLHQVNLCGGQLEFFGFDSIESPAYVIPQFDILEGLLPSGKDPVIILNTQFVQDHFFDLHLFIEAGDQWIVFLDSTSEGKNLQASQQKRLDDDFLQERRSRSKR